MDLSAVKAIVERDVDGLMRAMGVCHWRIRITYGPIDGADPGCFARGQCERMIDYETATITLDPANLEDEKEVLDTFRHELMHVVLAPFDLMRSWMLANLDGAEYARAIRVVNHATEGGVRNLERFWFGMTERRDLETKPQPEPKSMKTPKPKPKSSAKSKPAKGSAKVGGGKSSGKSGGKGGASMGMSGGGGGGGGKC